MKRIGSILRETVGNRVLSYLGARTYTRPRRDIEAPRPESDPTNVDSELAPLDYADADGNPAKPQSDQGDALVQLVLDRYKDAAMHRRPVEREWVLSCASVEGRQWLAWDDATHRAVSLIDEQEPDRYVTHNLTRPLLAKVVALATMTKPDADCAPDSDSDLDRDAAAEGRAITAHLAAMHGGSTQTQAVAFWAALCGVGYLKHYWDPRALADIPSFAPDGRMLGRRSVAAGEEREDILGPFELYIDPLARRWPEAGWVIHASVKPLSWFVERFGDEGKRVEGDSRDAHGGYVDSYLSDGYGSTSQLRDWFLSGAKRKAALCLEMWEKPTPRYPEGRLVVISGRRLLYSGAWPLQFRAAGQYAFPFSRLVYQEAIGHAYGAGLVKDIAPLQVALNRTLSRIVERAEQDKLTVLIPRGAHAGADAFETDEGRNVRKLYVDLQEAGAPPQWFPPPPLGAESWRLVDLIWLHMQHIAGIHDINQGGTPPGVTAGISIELLQQGDRTQLGLFTANIEQFAVLRDELRIAHYAQYTSPYLPRLMGLDDSGNPQTAMRRVMAFRALTNGGSCSIYVVPGSATPKSPAGQQQEVLEYLRAGLFGPPGTPEAASIAVKLLSLAKSDIVLEMLQEQIQQKQANDPGPAAIEQLKQHAALAQQQVELSGKAQLAAIQDHVAALSDARREERELKRLWLDKVVPTLRGALDPAAVADLERRLGITGTTPNAPFPLSPPFAGEGTPPPGPVPPSPPPAVGGIPFAVQEIPSQNAGPGDTP